MTSDLVFMNVMGAKRVSIGTTVELGWADAYRKPLILVMEKSGNVHEHLFYDGLCTYRVDSLDAGIDCARHILMPRLPAVKPLQPSGPKDREPVAEKPRRKTGDFDNEGRFITFVRSF